MRILHLIPNLSGGGAEQQLSYLASKLAQMGHCVHIAFLREGPYPQPLLNVTLHRLRARNNYDPYIFFQAVRLIKQIKPDIIQTWILQMDIIGGIAAKLTRTPWIMRESSCPLAYKGTMKHRLREKLVALSAAIVSNSSGGDLYWRCRYPHKRRYIISNGLPLEIINEIISDPPVRGSLSSINKILLYAGRLNNVEKNVDKLIEAVCHLLNIFPVKLVICGDGPARQSLEKQVDQLGLREVVEFKGFIDNRKLWRLMKSSDLFCSLSNYEGMPNSVIEAMACGCPLVVSDIPAHREILTADSALFVDPKDPEGITNAIELAFSNPNLTKKRAEIAKAIAQRFCISSMAKRYEEVYHQVLENSSS